MYQGGDMKTDIQLFFAVVILGMLASCGGGTEATIRTEPVNEIPPTAAATPLPFGITYSNPMTYQVTYAIEVTGGTFDFQRLIVYQPKPTEWYDQKEITIDYISPDLTSENLDSIGNGIYYWDLADYPGTGSNGRITIRFSLTALETLTTIDLNNLQPYDSSSEIYQTYTRAERFIESDDPEIKAKAQEIAAGESNPYLVTRRFYDFIIDNSIYHKTGKGLAGAKALLADGKGECGDYSSLFIALSRASGIPARAVVGYWTESGIDQTHVWAEFYLEGIGWIPVDPTIGQSRSDLKQYYFGNMDNRRVILNRGFNIDLEPTAPNNYIAPFLQVPLYWFWGKGNADQVKLQRVEWFVAQNP